MLSVKKAGMFPMEDDTWIQKSTGIFWLNNIPRIKDFQSIIMFSRIYLGLSVNLYVLHNPDIFIGKTKP